jgi:serine/threonine protein kinase
VTIRIRIEHGQDAGKTWRLAQPGVYVLGRDIASSIRVIDMKVSKRHAEVHVVEQNGTAGAVLKDLGSTHGSLINGQQVSSDMPLRPGDELRLGLTILRVLSDGEADEDLQPIRGREVDETSVDTSQTRGGADTSSVKALPPDELVGQVLGGYKVEKKIGKGGMGSVYLAEQVSLHRQVALKVLSEKFVKDSAFVDQFLNEARAAGALNHPNVVQVYDVGEADGNYYFSMEVVTGGSIEEKLRAGEQPGWETALNWFLDATNALVFAKKREILHRDVKPDNLMISEDGSAKLCDLGLAKKAENSDLMSAGIIGTPHFISPEAVRRKGVIDHRTDLYSLGCTFYRILAGQNPYPGGTVKEILLGHLKKPVPKVSDVTRNVPQELSDIVEKLMQKDPDDRFQTPDELLQALDKIRVRHGLEAHGIAPKSRKPIIIGAAIAVLVAAAALIFALNKEDTVIEVEDPKVAEMRDELKRDQAVASIRASQTKATTELTAIDRDLNTLNYLLKPREWRKTKGAAEEIAGRYEAWAEAMRSQIETWRERKEGSHADIVAQLETSIGAVETDLARVTKMPTEIRDWYAKRARLEKQEKEALDAGNAAIEKAIKAHLRKCTKLRDELPARPRAALELWPLLEDGQIQGLLKEGLELANAGGTAQLTAEEFAEQLKSKFPVDDWKKQVLRDLAERQKSAIAQARGLITAEGDPTADSYAGGIAMLQGWYEVLPPATELKIEGVDPEQGKELIDALTKYRKAIGDLLTDWSKARDKLIYTTRVQDLEEYFAMIGLLRRPRLEGVNEGHLSGLRFTAAIAAIERATGKFHQEAYKDLAAAWLRDVQALAGLFQNLEKEFPWSGNKTLKWEDADGKRQTYRVQAVGPMYITDNRDKISFVQVSKQFLLDTVFHDDKGEPRFAFTADDHRGLAQLCEMMGDLPRAKKHYDAFLAASKDETAKSEIKARLATLDAEAQAAGRWFGVANAVRDINAFLDAHDPAKDGVKPTEEMWEEFFTKEAELRTQLSKAQEALDEIQTNVALARTVWGSVLRDQSHPEVIYAGEPVPPEFIKQYRQK